MARALGAEAATNLAQFDNIPAQVLLDMSTILQRALTIVGTGGCCSARHRVQFDSRDRGFKVR